MRSVIALLTAIALETVVVFVPNPSEGVDYGPIVVVTVPEPIAPPLPIKPAKAVKK